MWQRALSGSGGGSDKLDIIKYIKASFPSGSSTVTISVDKKPKMAIWITGPSKDKNFYFIDIENNKTYVQSENNQFIDVSTVVYFSNVTDTSVTFNYSGYSTVNSGNLILFGNAFDTVPTVYTSLN